MTKNLIIPSVFEITADGVRSYDIFSKLLEERIIFLNGAVHEVSANLIISQLLYLESVDKEAPIHLYINSPGGSVYAGLQIIDTMNFIKPKVFTTATGIAMSMGFAILTAGEPGHRYALPNATMMAHRVSSGAEGNIQDLRVSMEETERLDDLLATMIASNIGMNKKKYLRKIVQDCFLTAEDSLTFGDKGVIDKIVSKRGEV